MLELQQTKQADQAEQIVSDIPYLAPDQVAKDWAREMFVQVATCADEENIDLTLGYGALIKILTEELKQELPADRWSGSAEVPVEERKAQHAAAAEKEESPPKKAKTGGRKKGTPNKPKVEQQQEANKEAA